MKRNTTIAIVAIILIVGGIALAMNMRNTDDNTMGSTMAGANSTTNANGVNDGSMNPPDLSPAAGDNSPGTGTPDGGMSGNSVYDNNNAGPDNAP